MNIFSFKGFVADEDGAVTVDWVVLTAAVAGFAGLVMVNLSGNMNSVGDRIGGFLSTQSVP